MGVEEEPSLIKTASKSAYKSKVGFDNEENGDNVSQVSLKRRFQFQSIFDKRERYFVMDDHYLNVTPDLLEDKEFNLQDTTFMHRAFQSKCNLTEQLSVNKSKLAITEASRAVIGGINVVCNLDDIAIDHSINTEEGLVYEEDLLCFDRAPSAFYVSKDTETTMYPPKIKFTLVETDDITLFELPSISCERGTSEANLVEQDNEQYMYLTVGKGKNRKRVNAETQTRPKMIQTRHTQAAKPNRKNAFAFASVWDMQDTYDQLNKVVEEEEPDYMVMFKLVPEKFLRKRKKKLDKIRNDGIYRSLEALMENDRFRDAILITERILACNVFKEQQKKFRGLVAMDPMSLDLKYEYTLEILWQLESEVCENHTVLCCSFNQHSPDILAVAYGKFLYIEDKEGMVCIWSMKNPKVPERTYRFKTPVTSLSFSICHPNWLACGLYDGSVIVLDMTSYVKKVIMSSSRESNPSFEPIWSVRWRLNRDSGQEYVIAVCSDGRISKFVRTETNGFERSSMMKVSQVEGRVKRVFKLKTCLAFDVRIRRNPICVSYSNHPAVNHVYLIGTDEGCLHRCSINYHNQHMDVSRAHTYYVYDIQFSPFWNKLYATCGADWSVRIWCEGIDDSLITLDCDGTVLGLAWCPKNASILVTISKNCLRIWDLNRKVYSSSAELRFPSGTLLTYVSFSSSGDCVFIGDTTGKLYTFYLTDMPIPPFNQKHILLEAIIKHLHTQPHLLLQLEKIENINRT